MNNGNNPLSFKLFLKAYLEEGNLIRVLNLIVTFLMYSKKTGFNIDQIDFAIGSLDKVISKLKNDKE